jgi:hypothetical protein
MTAREVQAALNPADKRLVGVLFHLQLGPGLVDDLDRPAQLAARRGHDHPVDRASGAAQAVSLGHCTWPGSQGKLACVIRGVPFVSPPQASRLRLCRLRTALRAGPSGRSE